MPVLGAADGAGRARFVAFARNVGDARRRSQRPRRADPGDQPGPPAEERSSSVRGPACPSARDCAWSSAPTSWMSTASSSALSAGSPSPGRVGGALVWAHGDTRVTVTAPGAMLYPAPARWSGPSTSPGRARQSALGRPDRGRRCRRHEPARLAHWASPDVRADDRRLNRLISRCLDDLHGLRMSTPETPDDVFLAAGAPWFFTLFGRDSLWAARMLLPLGTALARGRCASWPRGRARATTRCRRRSRGRSSTSCAATCWTTGPGCGSRRFTTAASTPPRCGSACCTTPGAGGCRPATSSPCCRTSRRLWAGSRRRPARASSPTAGATRPGWRTRAGRTPRRRPVPRRPAGAATGVPGGGPGLRARGRGRRCGAARRLREAGRGSLAGWAARLADRFRAQFWVEDDEGPYPAMALDRFGTPVDAVASNMGHLLGTGILDAAEAQASSADRIASPELSGAYGLRTMSSRAGGYGPSRYHCGTVWPHDTAIADPRAGPQRPRAAVRRARRRAAQAAGRACPAAPRALGRRRSRRGARAGALSGGVPAAGLGGSVLVAMLTAVLGVTPTCPRARWRSGRCSRRRWAA